MPTYCVEVEEVACTITIYHVAIAAEDEVEAESHVGQLLSEAGTVHDIPAHDVGVTVTLDGTEAGETTWETGSVWEIIETPVTRQGELFEA